MIKLLLKLIIKCKKILHNKTMTSTTTYEATFNKNIDDKLNDSKNYLYQTVLNMENTNNETTTNDKKRKASPTKQHDDIQLSKVKVYNDSNDDVILLSDDEEDKEDIKPRLSPDYDKQLSPESNDIDIVEFVNGQYTKFDPNLYTNNYTMVKNSKRLITDSLKEIKSIIRKSKDSKVSHLMKSIIRLLTDFVFHDRLQIINVTSTVIDKKLRVISKTSFDGTLLSDNFILESLKLFIDILTIFENIFHYYHYVRDQLPEAEVILDERLFVSSLIRILNYINNFNCNICKVTNINLDAIILSFYKQIKNHIFDPLMNRLEKYEQKS